MLEIKYIAVKCDFVYELNLKFVSRYFVTVNNDITVVVCEWNQKCVNTSNINTRHTCNIYIIYVTHILIILFTNRINAYVMQKDTNYKLCSKYVKLCQVLYSRRLQK